MRTSIISVSVIQPFSKVADAHEQSMAPWNGCAWPWCFTFIAIRSEPVIAELPCFPTSAVLDWEFRGTSFSLKTLC